MFFTEAGESGSAKRKATSLLKAWKAFEPQSQRILFGSFLLFWLAGGWKFLHVSGKYTFEHNTRLEKYLRNRELPAKRTRMHFLIEERPYSGATFITL